MSLPFASDPVAPLAAAPMITPAERAAIIVLLLGEEEAAGILSRLEPDELRQLGTTMCAIEDVHADALAGALGGFVTEAARDALPPGDRKPHVKGLMVRAVGQDKASFLMQRIAPDSSGRPLEIARWLSSDSLLPLIMDEPPQVIAVLLLLLDTQAAAQVLALLPAGLQAEVVARVARLGKVPASAKTLLNGLLERRMAERFGASAFLMGGPCEAAELMNQASATLARQVIPAIATADAALAHAIEAELVTFDMILALDAQSMGRVLRDLDSAVLIDALKGLTDEARAPVFAAMSSRAADGVRDEIEARGRIPKAEADAAQRTIIDTARRLADAGEISMGAGGGDFV